MRAACLGVLVLIWNTVRIGRPSSGSNRSPSFQALFARSRRLFFLQFNQASWKVVLSEVAVGVAIPMVQTPLASIPRI
jgi:hypothetical protein